VDAKNGTQNSFIPRAVATGNADLLMRSQVLEIEHDGRGRARGIRVVTETADGPVESRVHADRIVVSAGALESPRLLLASGLGNEWVGRNHHSHGFVLATAREPSTIKTDVGPGHSVATLDFVHRGGEAWGGGVLFDMLPDYPLGRALSATAASGHRYGLGHKDWMRRSILTLGAMSMVQEVPDASARISIDPVVRDRYGMPVVRAAGSPHSATWESVEYMAARAKEWIEAAGGRDVSALAIPGATQGSEHSAGTVRLGTDPAQAACDERGRVFGTVNVYVADASLHPTNGGFNPGLTAMANALRVATLLLAE
jgi:choline dehydrogenase-like flavoprotein